MIELEIHEIFARSLLFQLFTLVEALEAETIRDALSYTRTPRGRDIVHTMDSLLLASGLPKYWEREIERLYLSGEMRAEDFKGEKKE